MYSIFEYLDVHMFFSHLLLSTTQQIVFLVKQWHNALPVLHVPEYAQHVHAGPQQKENNITTIFFLCLRSDYISQRAPYMLDCLLFSTVCIIE